MAVGQKATDIARFIGLSVKPNTKLLIAPIQGVGREHPLSVEKLFPVLAVYRAKSVDEALKVCVDVNHAGGLGHTAVIFSRNDEVIRKFGEVINAGRIIVNSPGSIGALGAVYNDLVPTFSFGCGTGGGNSTTDNVNIYHYLNIKRLARRTQNHMWFRVPESDLLQHERGGERAAIPVAFHHHRHQSRARANRPRGYCPAQSWPHDSRSRCWSFPMPSPRSRSSRREWRRSTSTRRTRSLRSAAGP